MADVHTPKQRSRNMSAIRNKDTRPEVLVRSSLHQRGYRFRLNHKKLKGKPDIYLPRYKAAIFVHGCFWHGHQCHMFHWPKTKKEFWREKIVGTQLRDCETMAQLTSDGIRVLTVWECTMRGNRKVHPDELTDKILKWLHSDSESSEISSL